MGDGDNFCVWVNLTLHTSAMKPDGKVNWLHNSSLRARSRPWAESTDDICLIASCPLGAFHVEAQKKRSWEAVPYGVAQESVHVDGFIAVQRSGTKLQWETAKIGEA